MAGHIAMSPGGIPRDLLTGVAHLALLPHTIGRKRMHVRILRAPYRALRAQWS
jgi:hypothetical protein